MEGSLSMTANIVFGVAGYGPVWAPAVESWLRCVAVTSRTLAVTYAGKLGGLGITDRMYTSSAENRLVEGMLAMPDATHLFFTEIDMLLPETAILDLLALDVDIASGVYFLREGWGQPCLYKQVVKLAKRRADDRLYAHTPVTIFPQETPFKLGDARSSGVPGFGCVLFKRRVFERMKPPWFEVKEGSYGSDMFFYANAHDHGFDVWIDPRVQCQQIDYYITGIYDYHDRLREDPDFAKSGYIIGAVQEP